MGTGKGEILEVYFEKNAAALLSCPSGLIPRPGQYLLAEDLLGTAEILPDFCFSSRDCRKRISRRLAHSKGMDTWHITQHTRAAG